MYWYEFAPIQDCNQVFLILKGRQQQVVFVPHWVSTLYLGVHVCYLCVMICYVLLHLITIIMVNNVLMNLLKIS